MSVRAGHVGLDGTGDGGISLCEKGAPLLLVILFRARRGAQEKIVDPPGGNRSGLRLRQGACGPGGGARRRPTNLASSWGTPSDQRFCHERR